MSTTPLQRSSHDWIAVAAITIVAVVLFLIAFFSAPIRSAELTPAAEDHDDYGQLAVIPQQLTEVFRTADTSPALRPVVVKGVTVGYQDGVLRGYAPTGEELWSYSRTSELCALSGAWDKVVATYHTNVGCGDVVAIDAGSGQYAGTRSAIAPDQVVTVSSNDRVGIVGASRMELWRSDMVRTVEYGEVEAPQESDMQPNPGCTLTSALTRTELLAVTETCDNGTWLRLQDTTPEDSRKPEVFANAQIPAGSVLVGIAQGVAAVYVPESSEVIGLNKEGTEVSRSNVQPIENIPALYEPAVADLPHHMTFFDGKNLLLLNPGTLAVETIYEGALGTGIAVDGKLLYPIENGIAVANWETQAIEQTIPVDRGSYAGPVSLRSAGEMIVEKRGDELVYLKG